MLRRVRRTCSARAAFVQDSQTGDLRATTRTAPLLVCMREQGGGGFPARMMTPPFPLLENATKHPLPQPANARKVNTTAGANAFRKNAPENSIILPRDNRWRGNRSFSGLFYARMMIGRRSDTRLLADDEFGTCRKAFFAGAVPENPVGDQGTFAGHAFGEKNLQGVARPFRVARESVRRAEDGAALRPKLVEKKSLTQAHGIGGRSRRSILVIRGNEQQVRIDRANPNGVSTPDLKCRAVDFFERNGLRRLIFTDPVCVFHVGSEKRVGIDPAMKGVNLLRREERGIVRGAGGSGPHLPRLAVIFQISDARIVGRPEGLSQVAPGDRTGTTGVEFVENEGRFRSGLGVRKEKLLAVVRNRQVAARGRSGFMHVAVDDDHASG